MSVEHDRIHRALGTRVKLFPQAPVLSGYREPETVWISPPAGTVGPGPSDDRMYVVEPVSKPQLYGYPYLPPYRGAVRAPVMPDRQGNLDYLEPGDAGFNAAHMYGSVRRVLDVWESYFGRRIPWHFADRYERLELIPWVDWNNAHSGYGFIEAGYGETGDGKREPYALNFDVLAHETGHSIVFSEVGVPPPETMTPEYRAFQESAADLVALVAAQHFDSVIDRVLRKSKGDLYTLNEIDRIGELSDTDQIRVASNSLTMSDVADVRTPLAHLSEPELHRMGLPLTGAIFDIFVEIYQDMLVHEGLIDPGLAAMSFGIPANPGTLAAIERRFAAAYRGRHDAFRTVLLRARDHLGWLLAGTWERLSPDNLGFGDVAAALMASERELTGGRYGAIILDCLAWRGIEPTGMHRLAMLFGGLGPRGPSPDLRRLPFGERWQLANRDGAY